MANKERPKDKKITHYTVWAIVLVVIGSAAIAAVLWFFYCPKSASTNQKLENETNQSPTVADYRTLAKQYLKAYENKISQLNFTDQPAGELVKVWQDKKAAVEALNAKLLALSVPGDLRSLHLGLVTAYDLVDQASQKMIEAENYQAGLNGASLDLDKSALASKAAGELDLSANNKINQLLTEYPWLK